MVRSRFRRAVSLGTTMALASAGLAIFATGASANPDTLVQPADNLVNAQVVTIKSFKGAFKPTSGPIVSAQCNPDQRLSILVDSNADGILDTPAPTGLCNGATAIGADVFVGGPPIIASKSGKLKTAFTGGVFLTQTVATGVMDPFVDFNADGLYQPSVGGPWGAGEVHLGLLQGYFGSSVPYATCMPAAGGRGAGAIDANGDGDALDVGDTPAAGPSPVLDLYTGIAPNDKGATQLGIDLNGDGDTLDVGETPAGPLGIIAQDLVPDSSSSWSFGIDHCLLAVTNIGGGFDPNGLPLEFEADVIKFKPTASLTVSGATGAPRAVDANANGIVDVGEEPGSGSVTIDGTEYAHADALGFHITPVKAFVPFGGSLSSDPARLCRAPHKVVNGDLDLTGNGIGDGAGSDGSFSETVTIPGYSLDTVVGGVGMQTGLAPNYDTTGDAIADAVMIECGVHLAKMKFRVDGEKDQQFSMTAVYTGGTPGLPYGTNNKVSKTTATITLI